MESSRLCVFNFTPPLTCVQLCSLDYCIPIHGSGSRWMMLSRTAGCAPRGQHWRLVALLLFWLQGLVPHDPSPAMATRILLQSQESNLNQNSLVSSTTVLASRPCDTVKIQSTPIPRTCESSINWFRITNPAVLYCRSRVPINPKCSFVKWGGGRTHAHIHTHTPRGKE